MSSLIEFNEASAKMRGDNWTVFYKLFKEEQKEAALLRDDKNALRDEIERLKRAG